MDYSFVACLAGHITLGSDMNDHLGDISWNPGKNRV